LGPQDEPDGLREQRIKVWGRAEYVEGDSEVLRAVADADYEARLERAIVFHIEAWDSNCPQHIRPRYTVEELAGGANRGMK
jgi:predicted pyridoxine 5'-phosphate oxidase superfamily flavin-nucleotide-binding protein